MIHDIVIFILGLGLIILGGNWVTDGAVTIARKLGVTPLVVGLTVVAFGSSAPDFVVCLSSTLQHKSQLALGDIVGGNIFDILLVAGIVAMVTPLKLDDGMRRHDLPMLVLSSLALFVCGDDALFDNGAPDLITRSEGLLLIAFFVLFMASLLRNAKAGNMLSPHSPQTPASPIPAKKVWLAAGMIAGGLAILVIGGNWIVDGASAIALRCGLSEGLIGLTIVAFGSAAPDLATSLTAALRKQAGLAMGNLVGSCIFNVFFIIGTCATVHPLKAGTITFVDFGALALGAILLWIFGMQKGGTVQRWQGAVLVLGYLAYMTYLVLSFLK